MTTNEEAVAAQNLESVYVPTAADRPPGPYTFVRHPDHVAADERNHAIDLRNEHYDNTIWDRD